MPWNLTSTHAREGDLVQLVGLRHKHFIFPLIPGGEMHTHRGIVKHDDLIGLAWGTQVFSHLGSPFFIEELIQMLIDEGVIEIDGETWQVLGDRLAGVHVPPTLTGILQTRLDSLPPDERQALQPSE